MIVDARTYTIAAGKVNDYLSNYSSNGLPLQRKHGFDLAGYFRVSNPYALSWFSDDNPAFASSLNFSASNMYDTLTAMGEYSSLL